MCHTNDNSFSARLGKVSLLPWLVIALVTGWHQSGQAQWITQTNQLTAGWNAIYLHVDPHHADLDELILGQLGNPIEEVWYWRPALPTGQFTESPQQPSLTGGSQWSTWERTGTDPNALLGEMRGNGAYLVRLPDDAQPYEWKIKGRPVIPSYRWTLTGLNFIGFPVPVDPKPTFHSFLSRNTELLNTFEVYRYQGGELGPTNPIRMFDKNSRRMERSQAYWVRAGENYNQYFGPIQVLGVSESGLNFGQTKGQVRFRLRNQANTAITITMNQVSSETSPGGQALPPPTLLLRGELSTVDLTYGYSVLLSGSTSWDLAPAGAIGSEVEVVVGLERSSMFGNPGDLFGSVLRFTDNLGLSQVDMAVSAEKASSAGLWVGGASVTNVQHQLTFYAKATNAVAMTNLLTSYGLGQGIDGFRYELDDASGQILVFGGPDPENPSKGQYLKDKARPDNNLPGTVPRPFPLRLIVHHTGNSASLLQRVYYGADQYTNIVLTLDANLLLPSRLSDARRISSVHLPLAGQFGFDSGNMAPASSISAHVVLGYRDDLNPFVHTYHPDHDNLNAQFDSTRLPLGAESYEVTRRITLRFSTPENDFDGLTQGGLDLSGAYEEEIVMRGAGSRTNHVSGAFSLKRISDIATLTQ